MRVARSRRTLRRRWLIGGLAGSVLVGACVDETRDVPTGSTLYVRHCASCHGVSGRGDGPVAGALRRPPSDLTTLSQRHGGRFDESAVMATIDGRRAVAEHGPREMPVWGALFESEHREAREPYPAYTSLLDSRALTDYLRSLQKGEAPEG